MPSRPFSEVALELGLEATMAADVRATMTPGTWAALRALEDSGALEDTVAGSAPAPRGGAPSTAPPLPHVSIRLPLTEAPPAPDD